MTEGYHVIKKTAVAVVVFVVVAAVFELGIMTKCHFG